MAIYPESRLSDNDKCDNEMIQGAVQRFPGIGTKGGENVKKP